MEELTPWHRLFGLQWMDFFHGLPVEVEMEKDLSLKQQFLDIVILRRNSAVVLPRMPDGFEDLVGHNLLTFKSYQETLDGWALNELIGHYVNYRKQCSPSMQELLPERDFRLFAVCVRFPQGLARQVEFRRVQAGVYEIPHHTGNIRVVVVHELPQAPHNSLLHLFSARLEQTRYAARHYELRSKDASTLLCSLFDRYFLERAIMANQLEEFTRAAVADLLAKVSQKDSLARALAERIVQRMSAEERLELVENHLEGVPAEKRLEGVPVEKRLEGVPVEKRLEGVPMEKRLEGISVEKRLEGISVDELLRALPAEKREELSQHLKMNGNSPQQP